MKKTIIYASVILLAAACNMKGSGDKAVADKPVSVSTNDDYPYTLNEGWKDWQTGDKKHIATVLKMLKAWETKNVAECVSYFADTAGFSMDKYHSVLPHDSITGFIQGTYTNYKDLKITVQDWESVISADKKDEWVTVWYRQFWVNSKGIADSVDLINEAKMKDGKIIYLDEYSMHFPEAKK